MTTKIALIASVMLLGLSGAAVAGSARVPLHGSAVPASRQSADPLSPSIRLRSRRRPSPTLTVIMADRSRTTEIAGSTMIAASCSSRREAAACLRSPAGGRLLYRRKRTGGTTLKSPKGPISEVGQLPGQVCLSLNSGNAAPGSACRFRAKSGSGCPKASRPRVRDPTECDVRKMPTGTLLT
jgi:hypothetical protein